MNIEIAFATPESQQLIELSLQEGATVADAIKASGLSKFFPGHQLDDLQAGIWGNPVDRQQALKPGDRVELYRELELDPKEARRLRALDPVPVPFESR